MNKNCPNCSAALVYDIELGKLSCDKCGSVFDVKEFDSDIDTKELLEPELIEIGEEDKINLSIYTCQTCGASISITNTEVSTFCIYCGNPTILFSRVTDMKKPDGIIPFSITKEEALSKINSKLKKGLFIPGEVKRINPELVRGIYIPYHLNNLSIADSQIYRSRIKSGKHSTTIYTKVNGFCDFDKITTDASTRFDNECSQRLEPYIISELQPFDEDYFTGFYADIPDETEQQSKKYALTRAFTLFCRSAKTNVRGSSKTLIANAKHHKFKQETQTIFLPVWFCTYRYKNVPYTMLINGQTGTLVGAAPIDAKKSVLFLLIVGSILVAGAVFLTLLLEFETAAKLAFVSLFPIVAGILYIKKVVDSIKRTTSDKMFKFSSKRSEGK